MSETSSRQDINNLKWLSLEIVGAFVTKLAFLIGNWKHMEFHFRKCGLYFDYGEMGRHFHKKNLQQ